MIKHSGSLLHPLLHASHLVEARLRVRLKQVGLRPRQARVLSALSRMGETHQNILASEFDITAASMSSMCDRLVAAGFIERRVDPNERRAFLIRLTPEGESKVRDVRLAWDDIDALLVKVMGPSDAAKLAELSGKLRNQLGGRIPEVGLKEASDV